MAQVPYKAAPSVEPASQPPPDYFHLDANPERFAAGARGLEQFGKSVSEVANLWGEIQTDSAANNAMKEGDAAFNEYRKLNGQDAIDQEEATKQKLNQTVEHFRGQLTSPWQQNQFDKQVRQYQYRYWNGGVANHANEQRKVFTSQTNTDAESLGYDHIAQNYNNPAEFEAGKKQAMNAAVKQLEFNGQGGNADARAQAQQVVTEKSYATAAEAMFAHNAPEGYKFVQDHEKELGLHASGLIQKFRNRAEEVQSKQLSDAMIKINSTADPIARRGIIDANRAVLGDETYRQLTGEGPAQAAPTAPASGTNVVQLRPPGAAPAESPSDAAARMLREQTQKPAGAPATPVPRLPNEGWQDWVKRRSSQNSSPASNFAGEQKKGNEASGAIETELSKTVDAHADRNFFSSGAARRKGIEGGVGQNLTTIGTNPADGEPVQVNARAAPHFKGFIDDLQSMGYKINSLGGYANRMKVGGFGGGYSEHAFGNAIDINPKQNPQSGASNLPPNVAAIAAKYGLIWGGNWRGASRDPMHFEWSGKDSQVAGQ